MTTEILNNQIDAVQSMQTYIEDHLAESISLTDLSRIAHFSPWYCSRIFKEVTGLNPGDYIRRLRLSKSAMKLRDEQIRVADLAFEMGFSSVDGYQRAFRREFGCNPKEYAKKPVPLSLFIPYGVKFSTPKEKENTIMEQVKTVFIQVIEKPDRKVIYKKGKTASEYWSYCEEVGCDVWGILSSIKSISQEPVCLWLPAHLKDADCSTYVQGVEVPSDYDGEIPSGFSVLMLPAAKYLMFQGEPFEEENYCEAIDHVHNSINQYDPSILGYTWDEKNPRIQLEPIGRRGYIELKAIK